MKLKFSNVSIRIMPALEFTPLEFETYDPADKHLALERLEFTPLEFETYDPADNHLALERLEFTPLEFETLLKRQFIQRIHTIRIYSVGV